MNKLFLIQILVILVVISVLFHDTDAFKLKKKKKLLKALKASKKVKVVGVVKPSESQQAQGERPAYNQNALVAPQPIQQGPVVAPVEQPTYNEQPSRRPAGGAKKVVKPKKKKFGKKKKKFGFKKFFG